MTESCDAIRRATREAKFPPVALLIKVVKEMMDVWKRSAAGHPDQAHQSNLNLPEKTTLLNPDAESQALRAAQSGKPPIPTTGSQRMTQSQECAPAKSFATKLGTGLEEISPYERSQFQSSFRTNPALTTDPTLSLSDPQHRSELHSQEYSPSKGPISQTGTHSELSSPFRGPHFPPGFYTSSASSIDPTETDVQSSLPLRGLQNRMRAQSEGRVPVKQQCPAGLNAPQIPPMKQTTGFFQGSLTPRGPQHLTGAFSQGYSPFKGPTNQTGTSSGGLISGIPQHAPAWRADPALAMDSTRTNVQGYLPPRGQFGVRSQGCSPSRGLINQLGFRSELALSSGGSQYTSGMYASSALPMNLTVGNRQNPFLPRRLPNQMKAQSEAAPPVGQQCLPGLGAQPTPPVKPAAASVQGHSLPRGFANASAPPYQYNAPYLGHQNVNAAHNTDYYPYEECPGASRVKTPEFPSLRCPCPLIQAGQSDSCERPHQRYGLPVFLNDLDVPASIEEIQEGAPTFTCPSSQQPAAQNETVDQPCPPTTFPCAQPSTTSSVVQEVVELPCTQPGPRSSGLQDANAPPCAQPSAKSSGRQEVNVPPCAQPSTRSSNLQEVKVSPCAQPSTRSSGRQEVNASPCAQPSTRSSGRQELSTSPCAQTCPQPSGQQEVNASPCAQPSAKSSGLQEVNASPCARPSAKSSGRQELSTSPCAQTCPQPSGQQEVNASPCAQPSAKSSGLQEVNASPCARPSAKSSGLQEVNASPCAQPSAKSSGRQELSTSPCVQTCPQPSGLQEANAPPSAQPSTKSSGLQEMNAPPCAQPSTRSSGIHDLNKSPCPQPCPRPSGLQDANMPPPCAQPSTQSRDGQEVNASRSQSSAKLSGLRDLFALPCSQPSAGSIGVQNLNASSCVQSHAQSSDRQNASLPTQSSAPPNSAGGLFGPPSAQPQAQASAPSVVEANPAAQPKSERHPSARPNDPRNATACPPPLREPRQRSSGVQLVTGGVNEEQAEPVDFGAFEAIAPDCPYFTSQWHKDTILDQMHRFASFFGSNDPSQNARQPVSQSCPPPNNQWVWQKVSNEAYGPTASGQNACGPSSQGGTQWEKQMDRRPITNQTQQFTEQDRNTRSSFFRTFPKSEKQWQRRKVPNQACQPAGSNQNTCNPYAQMGTQLESLMTRSPLPYRTCQFTRPVQNARAPCAQSCPPPQTRFMPNDVEPIVDQLDAKQCPQECEPSGNIQDGFGAYGGGGQPSGAALGQSGSTTQLDRISRAYLAACVPGGRDPLPTDVTDSTPHFSPSARNHWDARGLSGQALLPNTAALRHYNYQNVCRQNLPPEGQPHGMVGASQQSPSVGGPANLAGAHAPTNMPLEGVQNLQQGRGYPQETVNMSLRRMGSLASSDPANQLHLQPTDLGNSCNCNTSGAGTNAGGAGHRPRSPTRASRCSNDVSSA